MVRTGTLLSLAFLCGCAGPGSEERGYEPPQVDSVSGTIVVRNGPVGRWSEAERWEMSEVQRIGSSPFTTGEGPVWSTVTLAPVLGPDGRLYVLDFADDRILVFSGSTLLRSIGRTGRGPGDLHNPTSMTFDGQGRIWVTEHFSRRWSVFDTTGAFIRTIPFPEAASVLNRRLGHMRFGPDHSLMNEMGGRGELAFLRFDTLGRFIDESAPLEHPPSPGGPTMIRDRDDRLFVFAHREALRWALGPDETVWFAYSGEYRIIQMEMATGDTLRVIETAHRDDLQMGRRAENRIREILRIPTGPLEEHGIIRPVVDAIHVTGDGHLLVQISEEPGQGSSTFDVFSPRGVFLGTLRTSFSLMPHGWGLTTVIGDTLLGAGRGLMDVPYVVRAEIRR